MKTKVLIIGGAGFIGFNLAKYLIKNRDYEITVTDNLSRGQMDDDFSELLLSKDIKFIEGDFTNPETFRFLDSKYDYVYMLASVVGVDNTLDKPHEIIRINTLLIINVLEWVKRSEIGKVLFTSTSENYAGTVDAFDYKVPTPEEVPLSIIDIAHPRYTYAVTKILGESGFLNYSRMLNFDCTIVRYHNVFGPRMGFKHVIPHLAERFLAKKENPFLIYGSSQTRSFCYISDAIEGTVLAMESKKANSNIYHIGTEEEITIETLVKLAGSYFNYKGKYKAAPTFPGSVQRRCPDISKARKDLGYEPVVKWQDGLIKTLEWYKNFYEQGGQSFEGSFKKPKS